MDVTAASAAPTLLLSPGQDDLFGRLHDWQAARTALFFVYARSLGGLMQTGRGHIASIGETFLTIDAGGSKLVITLSGATFDDAPKIFFTPDLSGHFQVEGISVALANHDWLFFSLGRLPDTPIGWQIPA